VKRPTHGSEIVYVFKTLSGPSLGVFGLSALRPADLEMSDRINNYWVNFAKNADPNAPGLPKWPAFSASAQDIMFFDANSSARPVPNMEQLKTLDGYYAWRREEAKAKRGN
jgi:para-nitrobenzyl esterase